MKRLDDLGEAELLALAIASEEEDARIYLTFAQKLRSNYPHSAKMFEEMAAEESGHRHQLLAQYERRFGTDLPLITRQDVKGFLKRNPVWLHEDLQLEAARRHAAVMELESSQFYARAAERAHDTATRKLLADLAEAERGHEKLAEQLDDELKSSGAADEEEETRKRLFVLQIVQPALAGLIDGSVSTLAPIFAAAFATHDSWNAFVVGLAASIGAGISMGLTEALSDDGVVTGRGHPWVRGAACGIATAIGGLGHTLPYLIPDFWLATAIAGVIVACELVIIAWVRFRYMETPFTSAIVQIILGGLAVLAVGILIGSS
ncbi:MAG: iron exporter MbfA [Bosea sp. (in: a-proteobacteria)]|uniref:iron exporter MbfA n=1 Tax=unclassified Bosea (in: a-proteobacteria) TaxID=2653178 RepID=UPI0009618482|nr:MULTISPECIES: ferritin family protein [unclassified Bosea (in: a-proteobacteria)]MBN9442262.1 rubrerythrin [Bosea sp. (in: a-proteobacteria)]MBN9456774.1 rubrerythrin [Bosea sp. (in: a-proteobacteria)]OJV08986.1 MAG: rubrerythrin [Bosea sp. 67-29]